MNNEIPVTKETMNCISQRSPYLQIGMGAAGGFLTGFVFLKASKMVAIAAGGTILAIQLAVQAGVIQLDAFEVLHEQSSSDLVIGQLRIGGQTHTLEVPNLANIEHFGERAREACASSRRLCVAFLGGFLLGFGLA